MSPFSAVVKNARDAKNAALNLTEGNTVTWGLTVILIGASFALGSFVRDVYHDRQQAQQRHEDVRAVLSKLEQHQSVLIDLAKDANRRLDLLEAKRVH